MKLSRRRARATLRRGLSAGAEGTLAYVSCPLVDSDADSDGQAESGPKTRGTDPGKLPIGVTVVDALDEEGAFDLERELEWVSRAGADASPATREDVYGAIAFTHEAFEAAEDDAASTSSSDDDGQDDAV
jgi:hypothetical protein